MGYRGLEGTCFLSRTFPDTFYWSICLTRLQELTGGYKRLQQVTRGYKGL